MNEIYFDLLFKSTADFLIKLVLIPGSAFLLYYLVLLIINKVLKKDVKLNFFEFFHCNSVYATIIVTVLFNIYFFFLIKYNGVYLFDWSYFDFNTNSIYFLLIPQIITYLGIVYFFVRSLRNFKKLA